MPVWLVQILSIIPWKLIFENLFAKKIENKVPEQDRVSIRENISKIAKGEIGEKEIPGPRDNPDIVRYWKAVNNLKVSDDETPWCAAFVNWVLLEAGLRGTGRADARSFMKWGKPTKNPKPGDIVVFWRGKKSGWQGHVGFFVARKGDFIEVLGGNQSNQVKVSTYGDSKLLGFRSVD
jgi:uncharacterized protein (TIGR02594 family)